MLPSAIFKLDTNGDGGKKGCMVGLLIRPGRLYQKKLLPYLAVLSQQNANG